MLEINHKLGYKFFSSSIKKHSVDWITHYWQGKIKVFHICDGALICNRINTWFHWQRCLIVHYISNSPLDFFPFAITMNMKISFTVIIFISTHHLLCYFQVLGQISITFDQNGIKQQLLLPFQCVLHSYLSKQLSS